MKLMKIKVSIGEYVNYLSRCFIGDAITWINDPRSSVLADTDLKHLRWQR